MRTLFTALLMVGIAVGQNSPITFCAKGGSGADRWLNDHHLANRVPIRRPDMDAGCLDGLYGYEAKKSLGQKSVAEGDTFYGVQSVRTGPIAPVDVPAIREIDHSEYTFERAADKCIASGGEPMGKSGLCTHLPIAAWTCADKSRALLVSVDGKLHFCHKMQP